MTRQRITLDVKSKPDPPSLLRVLNVTHKSILLTWQPGFHGGMDQYFRYVYLMDVLVCQWVYIKTIFIVAE